GGGTGSSPKRPQAADSEKVQADLDRGVSRSPATGQKRVHPLPSGLRVHSASAQTSRDLGSGGALALSTAAKPGLKPGRGSRQPRPLGCSRLSGGPVGFATA